ncbi:MAG: tRNA (guanosine(37)-N1)-methyltransferase TrmD [Tissierellia bacterium]|nr:tRNA (guanosine(37)-N1)-methyltransferase TrmD [Tissierellia bacterium]
MKFDILTLFPEFTDSIKNYSIIKRGISEELVEVNSINIRDFSLNKHKKVDDYPYGGGPGMVMTPQPLSDCIKSVQKENSYIIYLSPRGKVFTQDVAINLSKKEHIVLICGHYEGIDQRIIDKYVDEEISIGDYILTGGELGALVLVDSISRLLPGVLGNEESSVDESFSNNLLEYHQYTRPSIFEGLEVPEVLLSGNHKEIEEYRKQEAIDITMSVRPDMLKKE